MRRPEQVTFNLINHVEQEGEEKAQCPLSYQSHPEDEGGVGKMSVYLIDHVGPVGGGEHRDVPKLLDSVHLRQELSQDPVADAAGPRGATRT